MGLTGSSGNWGPPCPSGGSESMESIKISVPTIKCGGCVAAVREALEGVPGVSEVSVELESKSAEFVLAGESYLDDALRAVVEAGHQATPN